MALSREDWALAAFLVLAERGPSAVAVEPLAARLGATKGSFYWHFPNRAALVAAALEVWETRGTEDLIAELSALPDPVERLRRVLAVAFGDEEGGRAEAAVLAAADDPVAGPVVRRVTERRLAFLAETFGDLGHADDEAQRRARLTYAAYIGWFTLCRATPLGNQDAYVETVLRGLTSDW